MEYETRFQDVAFKVWSTWTKNGEGLCDDMRAQTLASACDAACATYQDGISENDWTFAACMEYLTR